MGSSVISSADFCIFIAGHWVRSSGTCTRKLVELGRPGSIDVPMMLGLRKLQKLSGSLRKKWQGLNIDLDCVCMYKKV